jgi:hypothetical protein
LPANNFAENTPKSRSAIEERRLQYQAAIMADLHVLLCHFAVKPGGRAGKLGGNEGVERYAYGRSKPYEDRGQRIRNITKKQ